MEPNPPSPRAVAPSASASSSSGVSKRTSTSWAIRSPGRYLERPRAVGVQEQHPHLAAVAGIDQARRVHQRYPVPGREPGARQHQARPAVRDLERDAGAHARPLPGREGRLLGGVEVVAGVVVVRPRRRARRPRRGASSGASPVAVHREALEPRRGASGHPGPDEHALGGLLALELAGHARAARTGCRPRRSASGVNSCETLKSI